MSSDVSSFQAEVEINGKNLVLHRKTRGKQATVLAGTSCEHTKIGICKSLKNGISDNMINHIMGQILHRFTTFCSSICSYFYHKFHFRNFPRIIS